MPTKINAYNATAGEPIQLLELWFGPQLAPSSMGVGDNNDGMHHMSHSPHGHMHHSSSNLSLGNVHGSVDTLRSGTPADMHLGSVLSQSVNSLGTLSVDHHSAIAPHRRMSVPHRSHQPFVVEGLTFEHSDEALTWTLTKRKLLAIIGKSDCFVSTRTCPNDVLVGVACVENPNVNKTNGGTDGPNGANSGLGGSAVNSPRSASGVTGVGVSAQNSLVNLDSGPDSDVVGGDQNHYTFVGNDASVAAVAMAAAPYPSNCTVPHSPTMANASGSPANASCGIGTLHHHDPLTLTSVNSMTGSSGPFLHVRSNTNGNAAPAHVATPVVEPEYRPWPLSKGTLGELLLQAAEESGVALVDADDAPKASDAVGFAAAMVAKLCRKAILHNFNKSEAHFTVNLLVLSRPIGNEYAPSHGLYRVPHAPSAVTKERCSSSVVLSVIGKVMEETRMLAMANAAKKNAVANGVDANTSKPPTTSYADRPPLPRAAIGVAEKVKHYGPQLLQELEILRLTMAADGATGHGSNGSHEELDSTAQQKAERESHEAAILEEMLQAHFQNSIDVITQFTGADERDALYALIGSATDMESAAAKLMEGFNAAPQGSIPLSNLRQYSADYLNQQEVGSALESKLGNMLGSTNCVGYCASGAPLTAMHLSFVQCADRLISMGYTQDEAHRASRGAAGNFDVAAAFLAGDHSVQRHVRQRFEDVMWFSSVLESIRNGSARAGLQEVTAVVEMVAKDPQTVLYAWHTPSQQTAVKMLSDAFVQAIMQYKQTAMLKIQQQQQAQQQQQQMHHHHHHSGSRVGGNSSMNRNGGPSNAASFAGNHMSQKPEGGNARQHPHPHQHQPNGYASNHGNSNGPHHHHHHSQQHQLPHYQHLQHHGIGGNPIPTGNVYQQAPPPQAQQQQQGGFNQQCSYHQGNHQQGGNHPHYSHSQHWSAQTGGQQQQPSASFQGGPPNSTNRQSANASSNGGVQQQPTRQSSQQRPQT